MRKIFSIPIIFLGITIFIMGFHFQASASTLDQAKAAEPTQIHLITQYMDGVSIQRVEKKHIISIDNYLAQHPKWHILEKNHSELFLMRTVKDLSPVSKAVGVLGLKDDNTLTLFKGNPNRNQIIQTFFQIDIDALQVNLANQLRSGIPVSDKNRYTKMIQSFSRYAIHYKSPK